MYDKRTTFTVDRTTFGIVGVLINVFVGNVERRLKAYFHR